ncbi:MAG: hypothetical protein C4562_06225 [Actinobacteria bacterium]|nr:MAG: hypothetical protein C4562_06225 [Actinomycetota bacterium]
MIEVEKCHLGKVGAVAIIPVYFFTVLAPIYALLKLSVFLTAAYIVIYAAFWYFYLGDICKSCKNNCPLNRNRKRVGG